MPNSRASCQIGQHAAQHDVRHAAGLLVHIAAEEQQVYYALVHLDGLAPGVVVDGLDVVDALVVVIDVVELVVFAQLVAEGGHGLRELLLALRVAYRRW